MPCSNGELRIKRCSNENTDEMNGSATVGFVFYVYLYKKNDWRIALGVVRSRWHGDSAYAFDRLANRLSNRLKHIAMKTKLLACSALLLAACGGVNSPREAQKAPETRTPVTCGAEIALLRPDTTGGMSVNEALWNRRSWREYAPEALSLEELSGVLWAAAGVNRPDGVHLTAPSALGLYPIRVYAFLQEGVYRYDAPAHRLVRVAEGDLRRLAGGQEFVYTAPLNLVYIADLSVYEGRKIPAEHVRYLCGQDAAGYAENANLYAAGHGLRSITRGSAPEAELLKALSLDPGRYFMALAQTVGR